MSPPAAQMARHVLHPHSPASTPPAHAHECHGSTMPQSPASRFLDIHRRVKKDVYAQACHGVKVRWGPAAQQTLRLIEVHHSQVTPALPEERCAQAQPARKSGLDALRSLTSYYCSTDEELLWRIALPVHQRGIQMVYSPACTVGQQINEISWQLFQASHSLHRPLYFSLPLDRQPESGPNTSSARPWRNFWSGEWQDMMNIDVSAVHKMQCGG